MLFLPNTSGDIIHVFFAWTPCGAKENGKSMVILLPYPGNTADEFIENLTRGFDCASQGIDHIGKPYGRELIYRRAQTA